MTESAIQAAHDAPPRSRVSRYVYEPGDEIEGTSRPCIGYALEGNFTFVSDEGEASFEEGDVFLFAGGDYTLKVDAAAPAVVVWAWELPQGFA